MYRIEKYNSQYYIQWNEFILKSKNGTFLFHRDFMEYHKDRFIDFSLMVFEGNKLVAALPANIVNNIVYSHQGLTYGGLIYTGKLKLVNVIDVFKEMLHYLYCNNIKDFVVKQIPFIYHKHPAQETEYALFLTKAKLIRRDALQVIDSYNRIKTASNRMEGVKKAESLGLKVTEETDFSEFWEKVLEPNLEAKHGVKPVHNLEEITRLKSRFPENIKLFTVRHNGIITAGTVLFETDMVVHAQYISANHEKNKLGSLDYLYYTLITETFKHKRYFDFGTSNEQQGKKLNNGLAFWKESFGARTIVQDFYEIETKNYILLESVIL